MEFKKLESWMRSVELQLWRFGLPKENLDKLSALRLEFVHDLGFEDIDNGVWIKMDAPQENNVEILNNKQSASAVQIADGIQAIYTSHNLLRKKDISDLDEFCRQLRTL